MSTLQTYSGNSLAAPSSNRLPTKTNKALGQLQQATIVQTARIQATQHLTREALYAVTDISELEGQLAEMCPLATSRLEFIANAGSMSIARRVTDFNS